MIKDLLLPGELTVVFFGITPALVDTFFAIQRKFVANGQIIVLKAHMLVNPQLITRLIWEPCSIDRSAYFLKCSIFSFRRNWVGQKRLMRILPSRLRRQVFSFFVHLAIVRSKNINNQAAIVPKISSTLTCWWFLIAFGLMANCLKKWDNIKLLWNSTLYVTIENSFSMVSGLPNCITLSVATVVKAVLKWKVKLLACEFSSPANCLASRKHLYGALHKFFRVLKTDLDLRAICHQKDENTMPHLRQGLLAYWLVNTVRHQLWKCLRVSNLLDRWSPGRPQSHLLSACPGYDSFRARRFCPCPFPLLFIVVFF